MSFTEYNIQSILSMPSLVNISSLPTELHLLVASFLPMSLVCRMKQVSKQFNLIYGDKFIEQKRQQILNNILNNHYFSYFYSFNYIQNGYQGIDKLFFTHIINKKINNMSDLEKRADKYIPI